jgi:hypothetical protein
LRKPDWGTGCLAKYVNASKLRPQLVPGEITRWDNHLLPPAAMLYVTHMAFQKTITSAV